MISIDIYTSEGILTFQEEIERFNWSVKNNDSLLFNVTVPTIGATIVLHSIDSALYDIAQGDVVIVKAPTGDEKLKVIVTSVTVLEQKGIAEIECAGQGIADNPLGKGVYDLTTDYVGLATTWAEFKHPTGSEELSPLPGYGIVKENEDELLSYIWGREELMYLTPLSGINTTQKWKAITEEEATSITWQFTPDSIIDYDISPARPPVTDITTPQKVEELPNSIVATPGKVNIVKPFYIEEHDDLEPIGKRVHCVYTLRRKGAEHSHLIESQALTWSDNHMTDLGTIDRHLVLGVFTDSFVEYLSGAAVPASITVTGDANMYVYQGGPISVQGRLYYVWAKDGVDTRVITPVRAVVAGAEGTDAYYLAHTDEIEEGPFKVASFVAGSNRVCKCDKNTKLVLASAPFGYAVEDYFELTDIASHGFDEKTVTSVYGTHEVMWCNKTNALASHTMLVGITNDLVLQNTGEVWSSNMRTTNAQPYWFVAAQRRGLQTGDMFNVLFMTRWVEGSSFNMTQMYMNMRYKPGTANWDGGKWGHFFVDAFGLPYAKYAKGKPVDMFDEGYSGTTKLPMTVLVEIEYTSGDKYTYRQVFTSASMTPAQNRLDGHWQYIDSNDVDIVEETKANKVQLFPVASLEDVELTASLEVLQTPYGVALQRISMISFLEFTRGMVDFVRNKNGFMFVMETDAEDTYDLVLGSGYVPWAQRTASVANRSYHLRDGEQNAVHLPFIVAPIDRLSIPTEERGRIVVDAMFFSLYPGIELVEHKYVENLDMPALMTTVLVDVGDGKPAMRMRVIGIDLEYTGITRMRVHGIIY